MLLESQTLKLANKQSGPKLRIKTLVYYAGHILATYDFCSMVNVFQVNGPLIERIELDRFFTQSNLKCQQVGYVLMPRLDWQDREFDTMQRSQKILPRKIIFAGEYNAIGEEATSTRPFLMLFDRVKLDCTITKPFKSRGLISAL